MLPLWTPAANIEFARKKSLRGMNTRPGSKQEAYCKGLTKSSLVSAQKLSPCCSLDERQMRLRRNLEEKMSESSTIQHLHLVM